MAEQLICNQQVDGSTPFTSSSKYGGIPERPKGADCKSVVTDFAGPNPASPTIRKNRPLRSVFSYGMGSSAFGAGTLVLLVRMPSQSASSSLVNAGRRHLRLWRIPCFPTCYPNYSARPLRSFFMSFPIVLTFLSFPNILSVHKNTDNDAQDLCFIIFFDIFTHLRCYLAATLI